MTEDHLLPLNVVARACSVSTETVRVWCREERIEFVVLPNGHYRVSREQLGKILTRKYPKRLETMMAAPEE